MQHSLPKIEEVNIELVKFEYYFKEIFEPSKVNVEFSVKTEMYKSGLITFFVHIRYNYNVKKDEILSLFHADYNCECNIIEAGWERKRKIKINALQLANILGMSIMMVRGAVSLRLKNTVFTDFTLPIMNPNELLKSKNKLVDNHFEFILSK